MTYPIAVERIHGVAPEPLSRSSPVFCANGCGLPAQVLIRWEMHSGKADGWFCLACAKRIGAVGDGAGAERIARIQGAAVEKTE